MSQFADRRPSEQSEVGAPAFLPIRGLTGPAADALENLPPAA